MNPKTYILKAWSKFIFFFINILALYLFLKGHNEPGGGFIAGIAAAISLVFIYIVLGVDDFKKIIRIDPTKIALVGLLFAYLSAFAPVGFHLPFLYHKMVHWQLPLLGDVHIGSPLIFDLGVFLVVVGVTAKITFMFAESVAQDKRDLSQ